MNNFHEYLMQHSLKWGGTNYYFKWVSLNIWLRLSYTISFYPQENLSKTDILGTNFCVCNVQVFTLYRLILQRCPTLGLYLKFSLYKILVYLRFCSDRFHYMKILFSIFLHNGSIWVVKTLLWILIFFSLVMYLIDLYIEIRG